ncbi:MAG: molybdopterin molybdotransferase MoeA [Sulfurovum sp.]|nr:molybdopterin molybdotransferase MoeA [Sulfurovum sp.]NNJ45639.1 molybdopterin molybdotransferase MoeA [Sulfurovum sp.]
MPVSITEALDIIYTNSSVVSSEILPVEMALGRVMSEDSIATFDLPRFNNSAMDGYAVKCSDANNTVECTDVIYAGDDPKMTLQATKAIKIMTGAPIPEGCEAVIPIENVTVNDTQITLPEEIKKDGHIRHAGEDIKSGAVYLHKGEKVTAYSIALLASQGVTHLRVSRKIKVAVFGTGDELRPHFEKIAPHQLYNSNTPMFLARAKELGCEVHYIGSSGDTMESLESAIRSSLDADIIITSGGISMGDRDFTKEAFANLGMTLHFDKVDIKPGKPTAFGTIGETVVINLPGNPLASMVNYEMFVRAAIRKMSGMNAYYHDTISTKIKEDFTLRAGKHTVRLGTYDGKTFMPFTKQLPGMISPLEQANAMLVTLPDVSILEKGTSVKILPISWELASYEKEDFFTR